MTSKFTVVGTDTKITFDYTAPTARIQKMVDHAAEYLWERGSGNHGTAEVPITFASLTDNKKLGLVEDHLKQVIIDLANTFKSLKAQQTARDTEEASKYNL